MIFAVNCATFYNLVGQSFSALCPAAGQNLPAVRGGHSLHKAVNSFALKLFRLICSFHFVFPPVTIFLVSSTARESQAVQTGETLQVNIINWKSQACQAFSAFFCPGAVPLPLPFLTPSFFEEELHYNIGEIILCKTKNDL